jgi:hypothetical protein
MEYLWHSLKLVIGMLGKGKAYTGPLWVQIGIAPLYYVLGSSKLCA